MKLGVRAGKDIIKKSEMERAVWDPAWKMITRALIIECIAWLPGSRFSQVFFHGSGISVISLNCGRDDEKHWGYSPAPRGRQERLETLQASRWADCSHYPSVPWTSARPGTLSSHYPPLTLRHFTLHCLPLGRNNWKTEHESMTLSTVHIHLAGTGLVVPQFPTITRR